MAPKVLFVFCDCPNTNDTFGVLDVVGIFVKTLKSVASVFGLFIALAAGSSSDGLVTL